MNDWLRMGPGPVEQREQPMVEDVEKACQRRVPHGLRSAVANVLCKVQRHRPLRAEQAPKKRTPRRGRAPPMSSRASAAGAKI